jgi:hypothetical protein
MKLRGVVLMAGILSTLFGGKAVANDYQLAEPYTGLRKTIFETNPRDIGINLPTNEIAVWGVLMETGYAKAIVTLVSLADGTVSLYFSNGGGIIGLGPHAGPHQASEALLKAAPTFLGSTEPTSNFPLPQQTETRFYLLTNRGVFTASAREEDLGKDRSPLSPLFYKAQDLITQIRLVNEQQRPQQGVSDGDSSTNQQSHN